MASELLEVFFYGLFMDRAVLAEQGVTPRSAEIGFVEGFALRIGRRATLVRRPGRRAYGVLMTIATADAERLYAEASVADYRPETVAVTLTDDDRAEAVSYVLPRGPDAGTNPEYAARLHEVARRLGMPEDYCAEIQRLGS